VHIFVFLAKVTWAPTQQAIFWIKFFFNLGYHPSLQSTRLAC